MAEYKKKLIEVTLPLEAINNASAREKSIRHGHPSTLHLWWARRPLAAARAVIWASLVDDPSSHPEEFPTKEDQDKERERLFKILEDLVVWENSNNEQVLSAAKAEIMKSTNGNPPELLDPFAGGGAIPLEGQRLGLKVHAHDLNPVAVMINKAMIEIPPKFKDMQPVNPEANKMGRAKGYVGAAGLAEDVRYYGEWMKQEAFKRIGHLYPKVKVPEEQGGGEATVIAWIWARTVKCPNPACGCTMPLASSFVLSKKKNHEAWVKPKVEGGKVHFEVRYGKCPQEYESFKQGRSAVFKCPCCGEITSDEYVKNEGKENRLSSQMMAIVAEGKKERVYISSDREQEGAAVYVDKPVGCPQEELPYDPRNVWCVNYGLNTYDKLFTNRQLTMLMTLCNLIPEVKTKIMQDAKLETTCKDLSDSSKIKEYAESILVYLSFVISKLADRGSTICSWDSSREGLRNTFGRQALPMAWDYAEGNPFCDSSGCFDNMLEWVVKVVELLPAEKRASVVQSDAQSDTGLRKVIVSTDPPYYDNISYANLSDFFYIWLRIPLRDVWTKLFSTMLVPKMEELIASPYRHNGSVERAKIFFEDGMLKTCMQLQECTINDYPVSIYYAYKQNDNSQNKEDAVSSGWETMLSALIKAGFSITGTWPMRTEMANRSIASGTNALASSIVLVCRKRSDEAKVCSRRDFINELKRELKPALDELQQTNIAPVDLAQSAIGPGMAVFSKYKMVLESDGSQMSVRSALQIINQELDLFLNEQEGDLDRESRFCVDIYMQHAWDEFPFGDADTLARAKNTSVDTIADTGVVFAQKGKVHLIERSELPKKIKSNSDFIWFLTQQLTQAMETGGIEECAKIVAPMYGINAEKAKALAYRLYTIADRKGWTKDAFAYNSLVVSWSDIQSRAAQIKAEEPKQMSLFDLQES